MDRIGEAMLQSDSIRTMDPEGNYLIGRGSLLYFARQNEKLKELMKQVIARDTSLAWGYDWLGMAYIELKEYENSLETYRKGFELSDGTMEVGAGYGHALGLAGEYKAARILADYYASIAKEKYLPPVQRAYIHIGIGEHDEAIRLLEQAFEEQSWFLIFMQVEPWLDPLRDDPRFTQIMNRMNFPFSFSSEPAPEWTALMERTSGWFAADGIFTIPLDGREEQGVEDKQTLFIFSDTYIGEVVDDVPLPGNVMVNNTTAWMTGTEPAREAITFRYNTDENGDPTSYFVPDNEASEKGEYFWLGDGFINHEKNNALYLFAYHVHKTGPNVFDFAQTNIALLKIRDPSPEGIKSYEQFATGLHFAHPDHGIVYFGSGVFVNTQEALAPDPDGFVYIYGIMEGKKSLIAARVKPAGIERIDQWRFWDGAGWSERKEDVAPICNGVSNELSVTPTGDGRYILTFMIMGISDKIGMQVGHSPTGPFGDLYEVYTCPEYAEKGLLPYNAKAHYHLSKPGELLVSYNTITINFWEDIQKDATIYHPRFIKVKYR
jgi:tetratricopeptide (TPR) repeat protein